MSFTGPNGLFDPAPNFVKVFWGVCDYTRVTVVLTPQIRDWTVRGSYEYLYVGGGVLNWDQHRAAARRPAASSPSIADADENAFVAALVPAGTTAYIGLNDIDLEAGTDAASANWVWSDGSVSTGYRNFGGTDPTGVSEPGGDYTYVGGTVVQDVVRIKADDGTWADHTHEPQEQSFSIAGSYTTGQLIITKWTQDQSYGPGHDAQWGHAYQPQMRWLSNSGSDKMYVEFGHPMTVTGWETGQLYNEGQTMYGTIRITAYDETDNVVGTVEHSKSGPNYRYEEGEPETPTRCTSTTSRLLYRAPSGSCSKT